MPDKFDECSPIIGYMVFRRCPIDWRLKPHYVSNYDITYIINGCARYVINNTKYDLSAGHIVCLPEGTKKEAVTFPDRLMHCYSINFRLKDLSGGTLVPPFPLVQNIGLRKDITFLFNELACAWTEQQSGYIMKSRGYLLLILHHLFELLVYNINYSAADCRIKKAVNYIYEHYNERLTVKKLAARVKLNSGYFGLLFKHETGLTVHQYIKKIRVRNAEILLQSGAHTVTEVADYCGYCDVIHFYREFKAVMGISPSQCIPKRIVPP